MFNKKELTQLYTAVLKQHARTEGFIKNLNSKNGELFEYGINKIMILEEILNKLSKELNKQ